MIELSQERLREVLGFEGRLLRWDVAGADGYNERQAACCREDVRSKKERWLQPRRGVWNYMYVLYKANTGPTFLTTRVLVPKQCTLCCVRRYDVVSQGWFSAASQDNLISLGAKLRVGKRGGRCDLRLQVERRERLWLQLRDGAVACAGRTTGYTSRPLRVPVLVHTQNMTALLSPLCWACSGRS